MDGIDNSPRGRREPSLAQLERDAALSRVGRTRRWMIVGAAALTAAFAALASAIAPGRTLAAKTHSRGVSQTRSSTPSSASRQMPPLASPAQLGLNSPNQAPQSAAPSDQSQAPSATSQAAPTPAPAPAPQASGGGAVVSGGS